MALFQAGVELSPKGLNPYWGLMMFSPIESARALATASCVGGRNESGNGVELSPPAKP